MSEVGKPRSAWADIQIDAATLAGASGDRLEALEDAAGDVKAAEEHLKSDVAAAQKRVHKAERAMADRQSDIARGYASMDLLDRTINIASGRSVEWPGFDDEERDMSGVSGELVGFEVGTLGGEPIEPPTAVIFHVRAGEGQSLKPGQYPLRADEAKFTLEALPNPEEEPAQ